jgi:hypothetical protein
MSEVNEIFGIEEEQEKKNISVKEIGNKHSNIKGIYGTVKIIGIILFIIGLVSFFVIKTPSKEIDYDQSNKYVGGDAYNLIIASSIRGGEISAAATNKAIAINSALVGIALFSFSSIMSSQQKK